MNEYIVNVNDLSYKYPDGYLGIKNISFQIKAGEKLGIIGYNGAGKSTLLKCLVGLLTVKNESVKVDGIVLNKDSVKSIREKVGFIFQDSDNQLFMNNVYEDIAFGLRNRLISNEEIRIRVEKIICELGLDEIKMKQVYKLSGGQKKAVALAGVMVMNPSIILMDEPTAALDPKARRRIINIIRNFRDTVIVASHDLDMILDCCSRVIILKNGEIFAQGQKSEILGNKKLMEDCGLELPLSTIRSFR